MRARHRPSEAWLLDRSGEVLHEARVDFGVRRLPWTGLADVSPALVAAVVAAEDRRFFEHAGVDWRALAAAAWGRLRGGPARGASTLSMQTAALLEPRLAACGGSRSPRQKLAQLGAALALEARWTKREILEAHLNLVDFRGEHQGVAATARGLFGKSAAGLTEAEAAALAAMLPAPNAPPDRVARRACAVARASGFAAGCDGVADAVRAASLACVSHV